MTFKTHYEPIPVTEIKYGDGIFAPNSIVDTNIHWMRPRPGTVLLTREEVREMLLKAFDAGMNRQHGNDFGKVPNPYPDLDTYINNQFK